MFTWRPSSLITIAVADACDCFLHVKLTLHVRNDADLLRIHAFLSKAIFSCGPPHFHFLHIFFFIIIFLDFQNFFSKFSLHNLSGDDGYEQISSDEDDLDNGSFKLPTFDMDYTPEDLASVPPVQYDPYERELRPLVYFTPPYKTHFDIQFEKVSMEEPRDPGGTEGEAAGGEETEAVAQLKELLTSIGDDRDVRWVTALEETPGLLAKGLACLLKEGENEMKQRVRIFAQWALQALTMEIALTQPIALNLRQLKAGAKLVSCLAECPQGLTELLHQGVLRILLELLNTEHVSSTLKLSILKALNAIVSAPAGMEAFTQAGESEKSGYQVISMFINEEL